MVSLATASERIAVAHNRSGETLEYLQSKYRVRLDQRASPSFVPLFMQVRLPTASFRELSIQAPHGYRKTI